MPSQDERQVGRGRKWPCSCGITLGTVHRDELTCTVDAIGMMQTRQGALIVQCAECGNLKSWFTRPEQMMGASIRAFMKLNNDLILSQISSLLDSKEAGNA